MHTIEARALPTCGAESGIPCGNSRIVFIKTSSGRRLPCSGLKVALVLLVGVAVALLPGFVTTASAGHQLLKSFGGPSPGGNPYSQLMQGSDGLLYGTTSSGGGSGASGTIFKMNLNGSGFTLLKSFDSSAAGQSPHAGLIEGVNGVLYGTASSGGSGGGGTVFKMNGDGTGFTVLKSFDSATTGSYLNGGIIQGADGVLYGTAVSGGSYGHGTIFKLNTDGSGFTVLRNLESDTTGRWSYSRLLQGSDGALYGGTQYGGRYNCGTIFRLSPDGSNFSVIRHFNPYPDGGPYLWGVDSG